MSRKPRVSEPEGRDGGRTPEAAETGMSERAGRRKTFVRRARSALRADRGQVVIAVLCAVLGFAVAAQVRANEADTKFANARQDELVGILGDLTQRSDRLRGDIRDLEETRSGLVHDAQGTAAAQDARRRATAYGLLAGTLPATGSGVELTVDDPHARVRAGDLLDTLEELRDAGAEVVQVGDERVGVNTYFADRADGGVAVDGRPLTPPYRFLAIGDPHTMATALQIPGGILQTLRNNGAEGIVVQEQKIIIRSVRSP